MQGGCASVQQEQAAPSSGQVTQDYFSPMQQQMDGDLCNQLQSSPMSQSKVTLGEETLSTSSEYGPYKLLNQGCNINEIRMLFSNRNETEGLNYKVSESCDTAIGENLAQPPESHSKSVAEVLSNLTSDTSDLCEGLEFDSDSKDEEFYSPRIRMKQK